MFELTRLFLFAFAILSLVGGVIGFVKAGSKASLIAGGISGVLLLVAGWLMSSGHATAGVVLGLIVSLLLAGRFVPAFLKTKKVMPAGLMGIFGVVGVILTGLVLLGVG